MKKFLNPLEQRINIIRYIGDKVTEKGGTIDVDIGDITRLNGEVGEILSHSLIEELEKRGEIIFTGRHPFAGQYYRSQS